MNLSNMMSHATQGQNGWHGSIISSDLQSCRYAVPAFLADLPAANGLDRRRLVLENKGHLGLAGRLLSLIEELG